MADQMFVPLFLTAKVDAQIIDSLLETAPKALDETDNTGNGRNVAELVVIKDNVLEKISDLKAQAQGTRPPTTQFNSPYLNTSVETLTTLFLEHLDDLTPNWSASVFVIADSETAKHGKSVLLVYPALKGETPAEGREPATVRVDFMEVLNWSIQINEGIISIPELQDCIGPDGYVTAGSVEAAQARGEGP